MRHRKSNRSTEVELDITAFLNLMVVLIPFLLLNAVFAQVSVLQLNLPAEAQAPSEPDEDNKKPFVLEVLVYKDRFEIVDRQSVSVIAVINDIEEEHDYAKLHEVLRRLKKNSVDLGKPVTSITILCEQDTPYDELIQTMDYVRITENMINGTSIKQELFPDISIGSAPADKRSSGGAES